MKERGVLHNLPQEHIPNDVKALTSPAPKTFYPFQEGQCEVNALTHGPLRSMQTAGTIQKGQAMGVGGQDLSPPNPLVCHTWVSFHPVGISTHGTTKALVMKCDFSRTHPRAIHQGPRTSYKQLHLTPRPPPRREEPWGKDLEPEECSACWERWSSAYFFKHIKGPHMGASSFLPG